MKRQYLQKIKDVPKDKYNFGWETWKIGGVEYNIDHQGYVDMGTFFRKEINGRGWTKIKTMKEIIARLAWAVEIAEKIKIKK